MTSQQDPPTDGHDARRRFEEALARKKAAGSSHPGAQAEGGRPVKSSNDKRQRQFRRKSG